jgi:YVTN family beta-propeller protein
VASLVLAAFVPAGARAAWLAPPRGVLLPTGQVADMAGTYQPLLAFPTGVAVSPDGGTAVTIAGGPLTTGANGVPSMSIEVFDAATGALRQDFPEADAFQSVGYSSSGSDVYVAGGGQGAIDDFAVGRSGLLTGPTTLTVSGCSFVSGFALSPDGRSLWAACPDDGRLVELALPGAAQEKSVKVPDPDQVAISGATVYATDWKGDTVAAVDAGTGAVREITVGAQPEGIAALAGGRVVVADSGDATIATVAPGGEAALSSVARVGYGTDSPSMVTAGPGGRLYVTLAHDNAVAVLEPARGDPERWQVRGLIPTGWYPTALALGQGGADLYAVSARGLGHSAAATAPFVSPDPAALGADGAYATVGTLQRIATPDGGQLRADTRAAMASLHPWRAHGRTPLTDGPAGPIKHVIYITRENKLYDTELGDLTPGPGTALAVFGQTVTPNLHALVRRYVDATSFYYPAFRSTTGHMWEDAGGPTDVYEREATENYLGSSWSEKANYPVAGLLVDQALGAGMTVRTYNEETAQQSELLPAQYQAPTSVFRNYDLSYSDTDREHGWEAEFDQFVAHRCTGVLAVTYGADCQLPSLEYVYLGEDHTTVVDEPGYPTVEAQVADNDYATARIVQAVSHSPYWGSTLIVITEDDPQGTGDHVSAYRGLVAIASPWVKRGYATNVHYDWASAVGAIERVLGLTPLSDYVATTPPLADVFTNQPDFTPFTADASGITVYPFTPLPASPVPLPSLP